MVQWHPSLPDPKFGNPSTTAENRISSDGEIAVRQRVIDPNYRQTMSVSWTMTEAQFRVFESWHYYWINDGISWFDMAWVGFEGRARFTSTVTGRLNGALWEVSGEVELDYAVSG